MDSPQSETVLYLRALDLYASSPFLDFEDALSAVYIEKQGLTEILSYDADFDRVSGIVRQEAVAFRARSVPCLRSSSLSSSTI